MRQRDFILPTKTVTVLSWFQYSLKFCWNKWLSELKKQLRKKIRTEKYSNKLNRTHNKSRDRKKWLGKLKKSGEGQENPSHLYHFCLGPGQTELTFPAVPGSPLVNQPSVLKSLKEKTLKQNFCYHRTIFWSLRWINAALGFGGKIIEVLNKYSQASFQWGECSPAAGPLLFSAAAGDGTMVKTTYRAQRTSVLNYATKKEVGMRQLSPKEAEEWIPLDLGQLLSWTVYE